MKCWEQSACRALGQQLVVKGCLHRTIRWNESGFSYRPDPKHVGAVIATLSLEDARPVATPFTLDTGKEQANTLSELSVTEQAIYMSGSGLLQYIALDRMDVVFATKEVRWRTAKPDVLALLLLERVARYLFGHREENDKLSVRKQSHHRSTATQMLTGPAK